jgi:hypothetical protein
LQQHIGGTLAGPADMVAGSAPKGEVWAIRTSTPDLVVPLSAVQIGRPGRVTFQLLTTGTTVPPVAWPGGGTGYLYMTADRGSTFRQRGCWEIRVVGGQDADRIVTEVR